MAFLNVNGTDVSVAFNAPVERRGQPIGELRRSFNGELLSSVRNFRDEYGPIQTVRLTQSNADTLWNALVAGPVDVYGDLFNTTASATQRMVVSEKSRRSVAFGSTIYEVITFSLADEE